MKSKKAFSLLEVCISLMLITLLLIPMVDRVALQVVQTEKIKQEIFDAKN